VPLAAGQPVEALRFRAERPQDRDSQIVLRRAGDGFAVTTRPNRSRDPARPFFERDWPAWLTGAIYPKDSP
jgi:hypothetical protein